MLAENLMQRLHLEGVNVDKLVESIPEFPLESRDAYHSSTISVLYMLRSFESDALLTNCRAVSLRFPLTLQFPRS
jgi:hypothetical protein